MATTVNLLSEKNGFYSSYLEKEGLSVSDVITDWQVLGAASSYIATEFITTSRFVYRAAPSGTADIVFVLNQQKINNSENGKFLSFNAKIKPGDACSVRCALSVDGQAPDTGYTQSLSGGVYGAVQSNLVQIPDLGIDQYVSASIFVSGHEATNVLMTYPNLINDRAFYENEYLSYMKNFMPDFYWEIDGNQNQPTAPYHRLMDILTSSSYEVYREYEAIFKFDRDELPFSDYTAEIWANSVLVDPTYVRQKYINWLFQFTGNQPVKNIQTNGGEEYFLNEGTERDFVEWQLITLAYGVSAGTRESLIGAARQVLSRTKNNEPSTGAVSLTPGFGGNPWVFLVRTLENETIDAETGESSQLVLAAMEPSRPMGYSLLHETVDVLNFILNDLTFGRLDQIGLGGVVPPTEAPQNVVADEVGSNYVILSFTPMWINGYGDGGGIISNYRYFLSTNGGSTYDSGTLLSPEKGNPPITITGLSSSTEYYVKLRAINEAGEGDSESVPVVFTTL
jgi:hypothetical protein